MNAGRAGGGGGFGSSISICKCLILYICRSNDVGSCVDYIIRWRALCASVSVCECLRLYRHRHTAKLRAAQYLSILFSQFPISRLSLFLFIVLCARPWYTCVFPPPLPLSSPLLAALRHYFLFSFYPDYLTRKIHGRAHAHTHTRARTRVAIVERHYHAKGRKRESAMTHMHTPTVVVVRFDRSTA